MNYVRLGTIALAALALGAAPAKAQFIHFGITGGVSIPTGDAADASNKGINGGLLLAFKAPMTPFGLRADASLHHFSGKDQNIGGTNISSSTNLWMTTGNVTMSLPLPSPVKPYAIAGAGMYGTITTINGVPGSQSDTNFGFNGGVGVQFTRLFVEARMHRISTDGSSTTIVPLTFGLVF
jgi:opacity protein-like surface antigen